MSLTREALLQWLDGQRTAARVIDAETRARLRTLSPQESRAEYDGLCGTFYHSSNAARNEEDGDHLRALLGIRQAFVWLHERSQQV